MYNLLLPFHKFQGNGNWSKLEEKIAKINEINQKLGSEAKIGQNKIINENQDEKSAKKVSEVAR